jgi:hypothetical protein
MRQINTHMKDGMHELLLKLNELLAPGLMLQQFMPGFYRFNCHINNSFAQIGILHCQKFIFDNSFLYLCNDYP